MLSFQYGTPSTLLLFSRPFTGKFAADIPDVLADRQQGGSGSESVCNNASVAQDDERARIRTGGDFRERQVTVSAT